MLHHTGDRALRLQPAAKRLAKDPGGEHTDAYEQFLKKYPSGEFTAQAQARLKELYEERDWQKARDADTPEAYQAFLKQYPEGQSGPRPGIGSRISPWRRLPPEHRPRRGRAGSPGRPAPATRRPRPPTRREERRRASCVCHGTGSA